MLDILAKIYGFFATFPFISFVLVYAIAFYRTRHQTESLLWAVYITFIFLLSSVYSLFVVVTGTQTGFWILFLLLLLGVTLLLYLQWRKRGEIIPGKLVRTSILFGFFLFTLSYLFLFIAGIIQSMVKGE